MLQPVQVRSQINNYWGSVIVSCRCEKLVDENGDISGTQRKGEVRRWNHYQETVNEDFNRVT
jgi:hypothetical protein